MNKNICIVSDFFYPRLGGVEVHIYQLSVSLIRRGYKVIIITHHYNDRQGIRYMGNGIKIYYLPIPILTDDATIPTLFGFLPKFREILIIEEIDIVHVHQSTSITGLECIMHARTMGKHVVYTDHSLFAFNDIACINLNKVLKSFLTDADQTISVSYIGRDNLILRTFLNPRICNVIPNGVDFSKFKPIEREYDDIINIVCICRQTYRKGVDLLIDVIPVICKKYQNVNFLIGGDGPKKILLENMIKSFNLVDRVKLKGSLAHNNVRDLLIQGHIYLNTSLTEAFCIAIVEAASTGLYVVSTNIGGVEEVLPDNMIRLVEAERDSIVKGLDYAISNYRNIKESTKYYHERLKTTYNWDKIAIKTSKVYEKAIKNTDRSILNRMKLALSIGKFSGVFYLCLIVIDYLFLLFLTLAYPTKSIKKEFSKHKTIIN